MSLIRIKRRQFAALKHTKPSAVFLYLLPVQICSSCDLDWQLSLQLQMDDSRLFVGLKTVGLFFPLPFSFPLNTAQGWIIRGRASLGKFHQGHGTTQPLRKSVDNGGIMVGSDGMNSWEGGEGRTAG